MDLRQTILAQLKRQKRSRYWLARRLEKRDVCQTQAVYRYFQGKADCSGRIIQEMLGELGMELTTTGKASR